MTGKQLVEARAIMERAGFEVETERVQSAQPFDQVLDQDPNAGEEAESRLEGHAGGLRRAGRGARAGGRTGSPRRRRSSELQKAGLKVTTDPRVLRQGEEGHRDPDRAEGGRVASPRARACGCW